MALAISLMVLLAVGTQGNMAGAVEASACPIGGCENDDQLADEVGLLQSTLTTGKRKGNSKTDKDQEENDADREDDGANSLQHDASNGEKTVTKVRQAKMVAKTMAEVKEELPDYTYKSMGSNHCMQDPPAIYKRLTFASLELCQRNCDSAPDCMAVAFKSPECVEYFGTCHDSHDGVNWGYQYFLRQVVTTTPQPSKAKTNCDHCLRVRKDKQDGRLTYFLNPGGCTTQYYSSTFPYCVVPNVPSWLCGNQDYDLSEYNHFEKGRQYTGEACYPK